MSFTIGGKLIATVHATIPLYGVATADVELDGGAVLSGRQTLTLGDLSHVGTIVDGGVSAGRGHYQWMAGAGGWRTRIPARAYQGIPQPILRSSIISDAAAACGESVSFGVAETRLGLVGAAGWVRLEGEAWDVFKALSAQPAASVPWYVGGAGVTQIAERPSGAAPTDGTLEGQDPQDGRLVVVPNGEKIAGYLPGRMLGGAQIVTLRIDAAPGEPIRLGIWTGSVARPSTDLRTQLARLVGQETRQHRYYGRYRYRVVSRNGTLYDLEPVDGTIGLPALKGRDIWPGVPGVDAELPARSSAIVVLSFLDGLASEPVIEGFRRLSAGASAKPASLTLNADRINVGVAEQLVARKTDPTRSGDLVFRVSLSHPGSLAAIYVDEDGASTEWTITASNGGGPVVFVVSPPTTAAALNGRIQTPGQSITYG